MADKGSCKAESCERPVRAKGYCDRHYRKWRKGDMPKPRHRSCTEEGCHRPRARKSLCIEHFEKKHAKKKSEGEAAAAG